MMGAGLVPCCHTGQEPWADLLGAGTSRIKEPAYPIFISYETPSKNKNEANIRKHGFSFANATRDVHRTFTLGTR